MSEFASGTQMFRPQHRASYNYPFRYRSPPEKDPAPGSSPTNSLLKKQRETSETPIMRALKELDGEKMFKSWGTQTEKEDTSNSKYFTPYLI